VTKMKEETKEKLIFGLIFIGISIWFFIPVALSIFPNTGLYNIYNIAWIVITLVLLCTALFFAVREYNIRVIGD